MAVRGWSGSARARWQPASHLWARAQRHSSRRRPATSSRRRRPRTSPTGNSARRSRSPAPSWPDGCPGCSRSGSHRLGVDGRGVDLVGDLEGGDAGQAVDRLTRVDVEDRRAAGLPPGKGGVAVEARGRGVRDGLELDRVAGDALPRIADEGQRFGRRAAAASGRRPAGAGVGGAVGGGAGRGRRRWRPGVALAGAVSGRSRGSSRRGRGRMRDRGRRSVGGVQPRWVGEQRDERWRARPARTGAVAVDPRMRGRMTGRSGRCSWAAARTTPITAAASRVRD